MRAIDVYGGGGGGGRRKTAKRNTQRQTGRVKNERDEKPTTAVGMWTKNARGRETEIKTLYMIKGKQTQTPKDKINIAYDLCTCSQ